MPGCSCLTGIRTLLPRIGTTTLASAVSVDLLEETSFWSSSLYRSFGIDIRIFARIQVISLPQGKIASALVDERRVRYKMLARLFLKKQQKCKCTDKSSRIFSRSPTFCVPIKRRKNEKNTETSPWCTSLIFFPNFRISDYPYSVSLTGSDPIVNLPSLTQSVAKLSLRLFEIGSSTGYSMIFFILSLIRVLSMTATGIGRGNELSQE